MARWRLAPGVTFCVADGVPVFLDLAGDRYVAVPAERRDDFIAWFGAGTVGAPPFADLVQERLLLDHGAGGPIAPFSFHEAKFSLAENFNTVKRSPPTFVAAVRSFRRARGWLARGGIERPLASLTSQPVRCAAIDLALQLALRFQRARRRLALKGDCLVASLALADFLRRRHLCAHIVFGVTAYPFQAHCWVQSGDWLLNDTRDAVAPFSPILAV